MILRDIMLSLLFVMDISRFTNNCFVFLNIAISSKTKIFSLLQILSVGINVNLL